MEDKTVLVALIAAAGFGLYGAIFDREWFWRFFTLEPVVKLFGRKGSRVFYSLVSLTIAVLLGCRLAGIRSGTTVGELLGIGRPPEKVVEPEGKP